MTGSSPRASASRLTPLQGDLLTAFFRIEHRFYLTGGAALSGFYLGHRETEDLDLFSPPGPDLAEVSKAVQAAADACGASLSQLRVYPDFRRFLASRGDERCIIDLVIDHAPMLDAEKAVFAEVRVDTLREITANKVCTLLGRAELKDLVDLRALIRSGQELEAALADAQSKEGGVDPATLAWVLDQLSISPGARLPGGAHPAELIEFRDSLVRRLRALAFAHARREPES